MVITFHRLQVLFFANPNLLKSVYFQAIAGLNVMRGMSFVPHSPTSISNLLPFSWRAFCIRRNEIHQDLCCHQKYSDYIWIEFLLFIFHQIHCWIPLTNNVQSTFEKLFTYYKSCFLFFTPQWALRCHTRSIMHCQCLSVLPHWVNSWVRLCYNCTL